MFRCFRHLYISPLLPCLRLLVKIWKGGVRKSLCPWTRLPETHNSTLQIAPSQMGGAWLLILQKPPSLKGIKNVYPFSSLLCIHSTSQIAAFLSSQSLLPLPLPHLSLSFISEKGEVLPGYQPTLTPQVTAGLGASPTEASQDSPVRAQDHRQATESG